GVGDQSRGCFLCRGRGVLVGGIPQESTGCDQGEDESTRGQCEERATLVALARGRRSQSLCGSRVVSVDEGGKTGRPGCGPHVPAHKSDQLCGGGAQGWIFP